MNNSRIAKVLALTLVLSMLLCFFGCKKKDSGDESKAPETTEASTTCTNPLTGTANLSSAAVGKRPVAVVVENAPAARPQWGLGSADITVEGLVEGGITRMLWLYADASAMPKVGPTRSARMDFVEVAEGLDAIFVHFGGADTAYSAIYNRKVDDIDGNGKGNISGTGKYFSRDSSRNSRGTEHTAYTTGEWISNALTETGVRTEIKSQFAKPFSFNDKATSMTSGNCSSVKLVFSQSYTHTYKYNKDDGLYYNYMNTSEMVDENGKQMSVENVVILYFPSYTTINAKGSIDMDLSGGKGVVATNGTYEDITWKKGNTSTDMIKLYNAKGEELKLNQGKSYVALVPAANAFSTVISE